MEKHLIKKCSAISIIHLALWYLGITNTPLQHTLHTTVASSMQPSPSSVLTLNLRFSKALMHMFKFMSVSSPINQWTIHLLEVKYVLLCFAELESNQFNLTTICGRYNCTHFRQKGERQIFHKTFNCPLTLGASICCFNGDSGALQL